jgi:hypothetical protein
METPIYDLVLRRTGELQDPDNLGTIPTYTLATWLYSEEAYGGRRKPYSATGPAPTIVLQRMFLDARRGGWSLLPQVQEVSPDDPILKLFLPVPEEPIRDAIGYYAVNTSSYPKTLGSANDWAIWSADRQERLAKAQSA